MPQMNAPSPCDASKNDENVPTTDARSLSLTPWSASSNNAGYMSDMPDANTIVPTTSPATVAHNAMRPVPIAISARASDAVTRPPSWSGTRAPNTRTTRISTP